MSKAVKYKQAGMLHCASRSLIIHHAYISLLPALCPGGGGGGGAGGWVGVHSVWAPPRSGRSGFNGLAQPARVSEKLALYLLPRPAGYFSGAELAPSLITSYCCREGLLHQELFFFLCLLLFFFVVLANLIQSCLNRSATVDQEVKVNAVWILFFFRRRVEHKGFSDMQVNVS